MFSPVLEVPIMMLTVLLLWGLFAVTAYSFLSRKFNYWKRKNIKFIKPTLIFGNTKEVTFRQRHFSEVFKSVYDAFPEEKVVGMYRAWNPALLVRDPDLIKHVLIKDFEHFADRGLQLGEKGLGSNIFTADGDTWRVLRNRFTPLFTTGKLKNMFYLVTEQTDTFITHLDAQSKLNTEMNVHQLLQKYTIGTIGSCAFGLNIDLDYLNQPGNVFLKINELMFKASYTLDLVMLFPKILKQLNIPFFPTVINDFFYGIVTKTMKERNGLPSGRKDFMDLLLEMKNCGIVHGAKRRENDRDRALEITDEVMAAQAFVFYAAGYETTATTLCFLLYQLALNQHMQDKAVYEITQDIASNNGEITFDCLKDLHYLSRLFDETLRLYPVGDPFTRMVTNGPYKVPGMDLTLDKGSMVMVSVMGLHHDEKHFPEPRRFDPDRFLPENVKSRHPCAFLPFGAGQRNCLGMRFAQVTSRVILAKLLIKYRVVPTENTVLKIQYDPYRVMGFSKTPIVLDFLSR